MIAEPLDLHRGAIEALAAKYRSEGYEVTVEPGEREMPPALHGSHPDLIARRGGEGIVAKVKLRQPSNGDEGWERIDRLAQATRGLPGWRFELVIVDERAREGPVESGRSWSTDEVGQALRNVEHLLAANLHEAAILLLFSAIEARLRELACEEDIRGDRMSLAGLLVALHASGVLRPEQYEDLRRGLAARNAIAHGRKIEGAYDAELLRRLLISAYDLAEPTGMPEPETAPHADDGPHTRSATPATKS
jgi:hypothetical protein